MGPNYKINLELFEGPLDLLLHLIRKNDLDIYNIPIALILDEYLAYLEIIKELDIDLAGEFILLASELTHIKSRLLLHKEDEAAEEPDPRADLVARLLEYQKYKRAASYLNGRPILFRDIFVRKQGLPAEIIESQEEPLLDVEPFVLLTAFNEILKKAPFDAVHEIEAERVSITERIYQIMERLKNEESFLFTSLFEPAAGRGTLVITFLALLEMARLKVIGIFQVDRFGPIRLRRRMEVAGGWGVIARNVSDEAISLKP